MVVGVGDNLKIRSCVLVEYLPCGRICRVVRPAHTQVWAGRWRRVPSNNNLCFILPRKLYPTSVALLLVLWP